MPQHFLNMLKLIVINKKKKNGSSPSLMWHFFYQNNPPFFFLLISFVCKIEVKLVLGRLYILFHFHNNIYMPVMCCILIFNSTSISWWELESMPSDSHHWKEEKRKIYELYIYIYHTYIVCVGKYRVGK